MDAEDNGLTLEGLAKRLEAIERENERMRSENAELRHMMVTLEGSETNQAEEEPASESGGLVSSRALLGKAAAAAVAATAAGTLLNPREAKAENFSSVSSGSFVEAETFLRAISEGVSGSRGASSLSGEAVVLGNNFGAGPGVSGHNINDTGPGVRGEGDTGVWGSSVTTGFSGVYGNTPARLASVS